MQLSTITQYLFSGLTYGSIYAVIALGFNIVYNATGIINFAQGEFVMLGGMLTHAFVPLFPLPLAILAAVGVTAAAGSFLELTFVRSLERMRLPQLNLIAGCLAYAASRFLFFPADSEAPGVFRAPLLVTGGVLALVNLLFFTVQPFRAALGKTKKVTVMQMTILTIGLSILIREIALGIWGEQVQTVPYFTGSEVTSFSVFGAGFSPQILWVMGITVLVVIGLGLFFRFTPTGQAMRGCAASVEGARLCGINAGRMVNISFLLAAAIGAVSGAVTAPLTQTHYAVGTGLAIKGFTVAVFGGLGASAAAVAAGYILGVLEAFSIIVFPEAYKDIVTICILLAVLLLRPAGLFGSKETGRLKEY